MAESIHDGPVQDLIGLDMILSTLGRELEGDGQDRARELLSDARELTTHNVQALRDEMVDLGPYGFQDVTLAAAIEGSVPVWMRRYDVDIRLDLDPELLPPKVAGELFRISQEAVINAGRHAGASTVWVTLRRDDHGVELQVADDGKGFELTRPDSRDTSASRACGSGRSCSTASSTSGPRGAGTVVTARAPLPDAGLGQRHAGRDPDLHQRWPLGGDGVAERGVQLVARLHTARGARRSRRPRRPRRGPAGRGPARRSPTRARRTT